MSTAFSVKNVQKITKTNPNKSCALFPYAYLNTSCLVLNTRKVLVHQQERRQTLKPTTRAGTKRQVGTKRSIGGPEIIINRSFL